MYSLLSVAATSALAASIALDVAGRDTSTHRGLWLTVTRKWVAKLLAFTGLALGLLGGAEPIIGVPILAYFWWRAARLTAARSHYRRLASRHHWPIAGIGSSRPG